MGRLIADVGYFTADGKVSRTMQDKAYDLCQRLEYARHIGDGQLNAHRTPRPSSEPHA